jgi:hypothetical protein
MLNKSLFLFLGVVSLYNSIALSQCENNYIADLNQDCKVDFADFSLFARNWLKCSDYISFDCDQWQLNKIASQRWDQWRRSYPGFPIAAWSYFQSIGGAPQDYIWYKEANLNLVAAPLHHYKFAKDAGLNIFTGMWEELEKDFNKLIQYMDYPAGKSPEKVGYLLTDEPAPEEYPALGQATASIYDLDTELVLPFVNLYANYSIHYSRFGMDYEEYVNRYIQQANPAVICYDHYPLMEDGTTRESFYDNIELFRTKALLHNIGFMGFAIVTPHGSYRRPSESDLRWQVFSLLAYGAQGIWYYNYQSALISEPDAGMVSRLGDRSPLPIYYLVQQVNADILTLGPTLMSLRTTGVFHTGLPVPTGTTPYQPESVEALKNLSGDDFLIGSFENIDDDSDESVYLMIVNKRHAMDVESEALLESIRFECETGFSQVEIMDKTNGFWDCLSDNQGVYTLNIGGGDGELLRFN